ncbi:DNA import protein CedB [Saccharolobus caldissimus]|uniref:Helicase HerA central domain-containing protein n=1 Tax=Saccharolobus caldissimus TaxID=1702097 RepID=A0AAQ4CML8_9CREN|nr:DNA import protein CedB [Saccharolobus caldissimus]BDB97049.1 hypothetical protein SACC_00660 [Saccharolobus caldissimus]
MDIKIDTFRLLIVIILGISTLLIILYKSIFIIPIMISILLFIQYHDKLTTILKGKGQNSSYVIENGVFYNKYIANSVLIVDDIQLNYRDYDDAYLRSQILSFHKILDIAKNVNIIMKREHIDKNNYIESLLQRIQSLRVIVESDPSNEKAKRKLQLMQNIVSKIESGETPFKYEMYIIIPSKDKENALATANTIKQGLESLGIKSRLASSYEIRKLIDSFFEVGINSNKIIFPTQIPYLTPISIEKKPKYDLIENGILLGKELDTNNLIFWNINKSINNHVLVIGPTGSGKTEFLIWLSILLNLFYNSTIILFDVKGDIKSRFLKYRIPFNLINPLLCKLGLLEETEIPKTIRLLQIERIIFNSFRLNKLQSSVFYTYLNRLLDNTIFKNTVKWKELEKYINEINDIQLRYYLNKLVNILSSLDDIELPVISSKIDENEINIVDLTIIKDEEIKRLIIYSILYEIYNKLSLDRIYDKTKLFIVLDEAWTILKSESEDYPIVADLIKRGRGHGISIIMATQNLEDLGGLANVYLENIGLAVFMNNGDKKFWQEIRRFVTIDESLISGNLIFLNKGEALVRFLGDPRPLLVRLINLSGNSF